MVITQRLRFFCFPEGGQRRLWVSSLFSKPSTFPSNASASLTVYFSRIKESVLRYVSSAKGDQKMEYSVISYQVVDQLSI